MRFYDPTDGAVLFDGGDARAVTQDSLRAQMAVVFQENFLFNTTLRENIRMGQRDATDEEVKAAAKMAEIHDFIMSLPDGYDTLAGERGGRFSGGQRQRIALARALIREPAISILDEATSALDPMSEAAINATLQQVAKGRTVLSVTHRLASVVQADCIFVLQDGRVLEQGRHDELLALNGVYAQLWAKQSGFVFSEDGDRARVDAARLRSLPILEELDDAMLEEAASLFVTEHYVADRIVVHEGDRGDKFYIIVRGKIAVTRNGPAGEAQEIAVLQDGDHFGEIALLRNVPRNATIRTLTHCVFLTLQREQFLNLFAKAPHMREVLEQTLLKRIAPSSADEVMSRVSQ